MRAYLLIQTATHAAPLVSMLGAIPGILSVEEVNGAYDAIAVAEAGSARSLMDDVVAAIRKIPGVTRALPAPLIGPVSKDKDTDQAA